MLDAKIWDICAGAMLRADRLDRGGSLAIAALAHGVSEDRYSSYEQGEVPIPLHVLCRDTGIPWKSVLGVTDTARDHLNRLIGEVTTVYEDTDWVGLRDRFSTEALQAFFQFWVEL